MKYLRSLTFKLSVSALSLFLCSAVFADAGAAGAEAPRKKEENPGKCQLESLPGMCAKLPMRPDGITRLSKIEVYPQYLDEYLKYAADVGEISLRTEPGVLTMFAMSEKDNPCLISILEIYASQEAYKAHIASPHFQKYKKGTLKMVKNLVLSDQTPINPANRLINFILPK